MWINTTALHRASQAENSVMTAWHPACLCRCVSALQQGERKVVTRQVDNYTQPPSSPPKSTGAASLLQHTSSTKHYGDVLTSYSISKYHILK